MIVTMPVRALMTLLRMTDITTLMLTMRCENVCTTVGTNSMFDWFIPPESDITTARAFNL